MQIEPKDLTRAQRYRALAAEAADRARADLFRAVASRIEERHTRGTPWVWQNVTVSPQG